MTTAVIDTVDDAQTRAWWFLDLLVVEHRCAPEVITTVLEMTLPIGSSAPLHTHQRLDDTWYVLDGEMVLRCGEDTSVIASGQWVSMPRGVPHTFRVVGDHAARILLVHDNASFRDLIRDLGVPAEARTLPPRPAFPSPDELARVAVAHDLTPLGPPLSADEADVALATARSVAGR